MLYWLLVPLREHVSFFNVFRYITVRTALAGITALLLSFILGPWLIRLLEETPDRPGDPDRRAPVPSTPRKGTPSMGGILIIALHARPDAPLGEPGNIYVWLAMLSRWSFSARSASSDDYSRSTRSGPWDSRAGQDAALQFLLAAVIGLVFVWHRARRTSSA